MENNLPKVIIKCKHCGYEYALEELFLKDDVFGEPKDLVRDPLGKILYCAWDGEEPTLKTRYICDHCNKPFNVELKISAVSTDVDEALDFTNTTTTLF